MKRSMVCRQACDAVVVRRLSDKISDKIEDALYEDGPACYLLSHISMFVCLADVQCNLTQREKSLPRHSSMPRMC